MSMLSFDLDNLESSLENIDPETARSLGVALLKKAGCICVVPWHKQDILNHFENYFEEEFGDLTEAELNEIVINLESLEHSCSLSSDDIHVVLFDVLHNRDAETII